MGFKPNQTWHIDVYVPSQTQALVSTLGLLWRRQLTYALHNLYFKYFTFYKLHLLHPPPDNPYVSLLAHKNPTSVALITIPPLMKKVYCSDQRISQEVQLLTSALADLTYTVAVVPVQVSGGGGGGIPV